MKTKALIVILLFIVALAAASSIAQKKGLPPSTSDIQGPGPASKSTQVEFKTSDLVFDGTLRDRIRADLNGDGLKDLILEYTLVQEDKKAHLICFLQKKDGTFGPNPEWNITIPPEVKLFDMGDVAEAPGDELVMITDDGVSYFDKSGEGPGKPVSLFKAKNMLSSAEVKRAMHSRFLWDLDGDKVMEIILPTMDGPHIYKRSGKEYTLFQKINLPLDITFRVGSMGDVMTTDDINQFLRWQRYEKRITTHFTQPDLFFIDVNGDGKPDITSIIKNKVQIFCQGEDGKFPEKPTTVFEKSILTPQEKKLSMTGEAITILDLNGDKIGDIIISKWGSTERRVAITRYIYFGLPGLKYPDKEDQIIQSDSAAIEFGAYDLRNAGKKDLVIPFFNFAPAQAFKIMTENAIKIQFRLYLMGQNGRYSQDEGKKFAKPDKRFMVNYRIDVIGIMMDFQAMMEGKFMPMIHFGDDLNGDGYNDLAQDTGKDELYIYFGNATADFAVQPDQVLPLESAFTYDMGDINGDKKADIITYYESSETVKEKRKMAQEARKNQDTDASAAIDESKLLNIKEQTRVKILMSK